MKSLETILESLRERRETCIPESWSQGRTAYGGITGAILCDVSARDVDPVRRLRSIDISFVRPLEILKPFQIDVETLADGKTVTMKEVRIIQENKLRAMAKADFIAPLKSAVEISTFSAPQIKPKEESLSLGVKARAPFTQHFDNYLSTDAPPFSGRMVAELGGWIRLKEEVSQFTHSHLICLIDSWPPTAATHYNSPKPLSTINWGIHFAEPVHNISPERHLGYLSKVNFGEHGFSSSDAQIWGPDGQLLARSYQTNIIYG